MRGKPPKTPKEFLVADAIFHKVDLDGDGNVVDPCVGAYDACGVCNGPGEIYECGCSDIPAGSCDCDLNVEDECGVCGGDGPEDDFDCDGNCLTGEKLTLNDSYGDGWNGNILTINGTDYTIDAGGSSLEVCVDVLACNILSWTEGSFPQETSWTWAGQSGSEGSLSSEVFGDGCVTACTDLNANNANLDADISDNTLCQFDLVQGCTDDIACNYDPEAEQDNGSCTFAQEGLDCAGNCLNGGSSVEYTAVAFPEENSFTIRDCDGNIIASMDDGSVGFSDACVLLPEIYSIELVDSYGDSWYGNNLNVAGDDYTVAVGYGAYFLVGTCPVPGCTDSTACNYDVGANEDDGSCEGLAGCMDINYFEYDADATCSDGSCASLIVPGCTDATAFNFNADATEDDGSCVPVVVGCTNPAADNYDSDANTNDAESCEYSGINPWGPGGGSESDPTYLTSNNMSVLFPSGNSGLWDSDGIDAGDILFAVYETARLENAWVGYSEISGVQTSNYIENYNNEVMQLTLYGKDENSSDYSNSYIDNGDYKSKIYKSQITRDMIPKGQEDLYVLKSEIVPPVCPACPPCASKPSCPPCPPCKRCPKPAYTCKLVPDYNQKQISSSVKPFLTDFSKFEDL